MISWLKSLPKHIKHTLLDKRQEPPIHGPYCPACPETGQICTKMVEAYMLRRNPAESFKKKCECCIVRKNASKNVEAAKKIGGLHSNE